MQLLGHGDLRAHVGRRGFEDLAQLGRDGLGARVIGQDFGVLRLVVDAELEVQVRAGGVTGRAHGANRGALREFLAFVHVDAAQVRVHRALALAVIDVDDVAVAVLHAGKGDQAIAHGAHGCARGGGVVHARVLAHIARDGVRAAAKAAGHAREAQRRDGVGALEAFAIGRVVTAVARALFEPQGLVAFAPVDELGRQHAARAHGFAIGFHDFVDQRKLVATAHRAVEIHQAGKNFGQLAADRIGHLGGVKGREQHVADAAADQARRRRQRGGFHAREKALFVALDDQARELRGFVALDPARAQRLQLLALVDGDRHVATCAAQQGFAGHFVQADVAQGLRIGHAQARQQAVGRVAGAGGVLAVQLVAEAVQRLDLLGQIGGLHGVRDFAHVDIVGDGGALGHSERAAGAQQAHGTQSGGDAFGVALNGISQRQ